MPRLWRSSWGISVSGLERGHQRCQAAAPPHCCQRVGHTAPPSTPLRGVFPVLPLGGCMTSHSKELTGWGVVLYPARSVFSGHRKGPFFSSTPRSAYGSCEKAVRPVLSPVLFQALLQELVSQQGRAGCPNLRHGAGFFAVVFTECSEMGPSGSVTFSSDLQTPRAGKYLLLHQVTELFPAVTGSKTAQEKTVLLLQSFPFHQIHQLKHAT